MEKITLDSHFTYKKILRQCILPIFMMLFTSIYGVIDGLFISNFDSGDAFAGVNLIFPVIFIVGGIGFMFGSGGSALASKLLGENKKEEANKVFTMMIIFAFLLGCVLAIILFPFVDDITYALARISNDSSQEMIDKAILYGKILILGQPFFIVQNLFQNFFIVDEKPKLGFLFTLFSGITNIIFDAVFIAVFRLGVTGAAIATIMGYILGSVGPIIYFLKSKNNLISLVRTNLDFRIIGKCSFNGLSDFIFNISSCIVGIVYNIQLLKYIGQDGVSAYGVTMYVCFIFVAIFIGIIIGMAPVISYNYGSKNDKELKNVIKKLIILYAIISIAMLILGLALSYPLSCLFCKENELILLSTKAMCIYSTCYLFAGFSILFTGIFTALNNGLISGLISLFRSLLLQIIFVFVLPLFLGSDGIWFSIVVAEFVSFIMATIFIITNKKKYHY